MASPREKTTVMSHDHDIESNGREKVDARRRSSLAAFGTGDEKAIEGQLFSMNDIDPALDRKMRLVNQVRVTKGPSSSIGPSDNTRQLIK